MNKKVKFETKIILIVICALGLVMFRVFLGEILPFSSYDDEFQYIDVNICLGEEPLCTPSNDQDMVVEIEDLDELSICGEIVSSKFNDIDVYWELAKDPLVIASESREILPDHNLYCFSLKNAQRTGIPITENVYAFRIMQGRFTVYRLEFQVVD